ncbi:aminopeptidase P N-terminal domain-containing protein, partial [Klebsiella pneumoniae]
RAKNEEREIWDGYRYGPEAARETFGFDAAYPIDEIDTRLPQLMADTPALFYALGASAQQDRQVRHWLNTVRAQSRTGVSAPAAAHDIRAILD